MEAAYDLSYLLRSSATLVLLVAVGDGNVDLDDGVPGASLEPASECWYCDESDDAVSEWSSRPACAVEVCMKSNTFGDRGRWWTSNSDCVVSTSSSGRLGLPVGVRWLSLQRRSYDCWVIVELLPLERSDALVRPERTDSSEGLKDLSGRR